MSAFLDSCQKFIALDSSPSQGNLAAAEYAAGLCRDAGLQVELQEETGLGVPQANVLARSQGEGQEEELLLLAPIDTIDPGSFGLWESTDHNPFNATIRDGKVFGLGAAKGKLDFLCKLEAVKAFRDEKLKKPFVLAGTYGSQHGAAGAIRLVRRKKIRATSALVGGATGLRLMHSSKGMAAVEITVPFSEAEKKFHREHNEMESSSSQSKMFRGQPNDEDGGNAIMAMLRYLAQLPEGIAVLEMDGGASKETVPTFASLEFDIVETTENTIARRVVRILRAVDRLVNEFKQHNDPSFHPPYPTLNIGMVRTRAEYLVFMATCNVPPSVSDETYEEWMQQLKESCESENATYRITEYLRPFRTSLDSEIVKSTVETLGEYELDYTPTASPIHSEANVLSRFGVDCVLFGAGKPGKVTQIPNESIRIEDIEKSIEVYKSIVRKVCL